MILLPFKINSDAKSSGSYTELNSDSIRLFFAGLSFDDILNPHVSVLIFHTTPNALSFCNFQLFSFLMLVFFLQCSSGIDFITSMLLLTNFVKTIAPAFQIFLNLWIRPTASSIPLEDFSMSSIWKYLLSVLAASDPIFFHYLLKLVSKHNCCNLEIKYHQIDVRTFHDLWLDF